MLPLLKGTEVLVGLLLDGLGLTLFILALEIFLAWSYRGRTAPCSSCEQPRPPPGCAPEE